MQRARGPREGALVLTGRAGKLNSPRPECQTAGKQNKRRFWTEKAHVPGFKAREHSELHEGKIFGMVRTQPFQNP